MTAHIHTLLVLALLVPFAALGLSLVGLVFYICWAQPKGSR